MITRSGVPPFVLEVALGALLVTLPGPSDACDRPRSPLEDAGIGVAAADVVATVEVSSLAGGVATAKVLEVLKGAGPDAAPGKSLRVEAVRSLQEVAPRGGCGEAFAEVGKEYLALLWRPLDGASAHRLVDPIGGWKPAAADLRRAMAEAIARDHPRSAWSAPGQGLRTMLLRGGPSPGGKDEIDLLVLLRNVGRAPLVLTHRDWPEAERSDCRLQIASVPTKKPVEARDVPIPKKDIADYFSKHGRRFEATIAPGEARFLTLQRVTTAAPGWGYKEDLGFRYYPVAEHGPHRIVAACRNYFGPGSSFATEPLETAL